MAITFVGGATGSAANGGDATVTIPAGAAENDLMIIAYAIGDNDSVDFNMAMVSLGWTEVADIHAPTDTQDTDLGVYWKVLTQNDIDFLVPTVDGLGGTDAAVAVVAMVFRGVDTTTPMDVTPTTAVNNNESTPDPPSITHNNPSGVWTVAIGATGHTGGASATFTVPTNYDSTNDQQISVDDTSDILLGMAYRTNPGNPENPGVFTPSFGQDPNDTWCAVTIALRPATASGGRRITRRITRLWYPNRMRAW